MMKSKCSRGSIILEATFILPVLLAVVMIFVYLINIFLVQISVQYALNQTVNELGTYTYILDFFGFIDGLNNFKQERADETKELHDDVSEMAQLYDDVTKFINDGQSEAEKMQNGDFSNVNTGTINNYKDRIQGISNDVSSSWEDVKKYVNDPSKLISILKSQLESEAVDTATSLLGGFLGKIMMYQYADNDFLAKSGVVSTSYNIENENCPVGVDGMDFSKSIILGDSRVTSETSQVAPDSRVIDIIVVYRIKFPVNFGKLFPGLIHEGDTLYDNSLLIMQRAAGYGWINGDGSRKGRIFNEQ